MQAHLAQREGVFAELTATMPAVAIRSLAKAGVIGPKDTVVGVVTASGLKDLDKSVSDASAETGVPGTFEDVSRYLTQQFRFNPAQAA
jgi:threonine synthase